MGMGGGGYPSHPHQPPPLPLPQQRGAVFTAAQWAELEQQALICKYFMAGVPVRPGPHSAAATFSFASPAASPFYHHHHHPSQQQMMTSAPAHESFHFPSFST